MNKIMAQVNAYLKAHVAGVVAAMTALLADGGDVTTLSGLQWIGVATAYVVGHTAVAITPNTKAAAK